MEEKNFSLLNQTEIDALIQFLNEKGSTTVESGVLTQDSIDKIIRMLTSEMGDKMDVKTGLSKTTPIVDNDAIKGLELMFGQETDSENVSLYVVCGEETIYFSPKCLEYKKVVEDDAAWGFAIEPVHFGLIAQIFGLKYTDDTYENVVKRFAKIMYGSEDAKVAQIYLADAASVAGCLVK